MRFSIFNSQRLWHEAITRTRRRFALARQARTKKRQSHSPTFPLSHFPFRLAAAILLLTLPCPAPAATNLSAYVYPGASGRLIQQPDALGNRILDYSGVGYKSGAVPLPAEGTVPVKVTISPVAGDNRANIQNAINQVSALAPDTNGFRGAVLLTAGEYPLSNSVTISASGVVLRGVGGTTNGTVLRATSPYQYTLVQITGSGSASTVSGTTHNITDAYVPVGARSFNASSTSGLSVGDHVFVRRVATTNWIHDLGMDLLCCPPDDLPWTPSEYVMDMDRVITHIEGSRIFVDAPITCAIDANYTNGTVRKFTWSGRIQNVGIEHIYGVSDYFGNTTNEDHGWIFVQFNKIENGWARDLTSQYFGFACVALYSGAKFVTVADCQSLDPISIITGGRRYAFVMDDCTLCLVENCYTRQDRHQFVTQSVTIGPNAFVDGVSDNAHAEAGPHHRWATAALWDNITVHGGELDAQNAGNFGTGHGWEGANCPIWNCAANDFIVQSPPGARNWLIGSIGPIKNGTVYVGPHDPGVYESSGSSGVNVFPNSLYYSQLQDRLAVPNLQTRDYWLGDINLFTNNPPGDIVPVDPAWGQAVQAAAGSQPVDVFDVVTNAHWVPFTFNFSIASTERVVAATLALSLRAPAGAGFNDLLYLGSLTNSFSFSSLGWLPIGTGTNTTVRVLDLGGQLGLLTAGQLNVAVQADAGIEWAMLELQVAPIVEVSTNSILPVADATVRGGAYAGNNFGGADTLSVKQDSAADNNWKAYLRWDLTGVSNVVQAKLRLTPLSVSTNGIEHGVALVTNNTWSEAAVTWSNRPGAGHRLATWIAATNGPVELVVTPQVLGALAADNQLSLQLFSIHTSGASGKVDYAAREYADPAARPQLLIITPGAAVVVTNFTLSASPSSQTVPAGSSASYTVNVAAIGPFTNNVALSVSGLPSPFSASFDQPVLPPAGTSTLTITTASATTAGAYPFVVTGVGGSLTNVAPLVLGIRGPVIGWGNNDFGQIDVPLTLTNPIAIAAAGYHSLALRADGTVMAWGDDGDGQSDVPDGLANVIGIAAGAYHSLAVLADGSVVAWGSDISGQIDVPATATNVVAIAAGDWHSLALRADGSLVAWGDDSSSQTEIPANATNIVAIAAGGGHSLALRSDSTVVAWGSDLGPSGDYAGQSEAPLDLSQAVAVAAGGYHSLSLTSTGSVVAWGDNSSGQIVVPSDLSNVIAMAAGCQHSLALRADGIVVAWGDDSYGQLDVDTTLTGVSAIAAGSFHCLALSGPSLPRPRLANPVRNGKTITLSVSTIRGRAYFLQYKDRLTDANWFSPTAVVGNGGVRSLTDPAPTSFSRFYRVRQQ